MDKKEYDDQYYWSLVLFLILFFPDFELWDEYEEEIKHHNRFFPKAKLLDILAGAEKLDGVILKKGNLFYRARLFDTTFLEYNPVEKKEFRKVAEEKYPELKGKSVMDILSYFDRLDYYQIPVQLGDEWRHMLSKKKRYWGYDAKGSDAPPKDKAGSGRANPPGISYLYVSDKIEAAIMEVRPRLEQDVSVATIRLEKDMRIFDLCDINWALSNAELNKYLMLLSKTFSIPASGNEDDYYPMQYLCEYIKQMHFDGIRFSSSLMPAAKNLVLFNTNADPISGKKDYSILNSKVYSVSAMSISTHQIAPFMEETSSDK